MQERIEPEVRNHKEHSHLRKSTRQIKNKKRCLRVLGYGLDCDLCLPLYFLFSNIYTELKKKK